MNAAEDGGVVMAVSDTGIGMSADEIVVALKPFGQIDHALSRNHGVVGLGLPLYKAMVEMHQRRLEIISEPGRGTTIGVHLPPSRTITASSGRRGGTRTADLVEP